MQGSLKKESQERLNRIKAETEKYSDPSQDNERRSTIVSLRFNRKESSGRRDTIVFDPAAAPNLSGDNSSNMANNKEGETHRPSFFERISRRISRVAPDNPDNNGQGNGRG